MRTFYACALAISACIMLGCAHDAPVDPGLGKDTRLAQAYNIGAVPIFPRPLDGDTRFFYDADTSSILNGSNGYDWTDANGRHWAVAVSLAEPNIQPDSGRWISYRFLRCDVNQGPETVSILRDVVLDAQVPPDPSPSLPANVRFARVASCYLESPEYPEYFFFVEVTIVFQIWFAAENRWWVGIHRMGFDPAAFLNINTIQPLWTRTNYLKDGVSPYGVMMPDVAYDPRNNNGTLLAVFTKYATANNAWVSGDCGFRDWGGDGKTVNWVAAPYPYYQMLDHNGFHPRVAIGNCTLGGVQPAWRFGIAYTGATYVGADQFRAWLSFGLVDSLPGFTDLAIPSPLGYKNAAMPTIDIGLPNSDHAAIAWTVSRSESWNDVTIMVLDNHGGFYDFDNYGAQSCYSSPSIAMMNTLGPGFRMAVSYLRSRNPSSQAWNPASVVLMTNVNANPMETYGTETLVSQTINGRWDSGAQYTNWYGPSTSIAVMDPLYWILWSSWQNGQFGLNQVYGAYGYPEP